MTIVYYPNIRILNRDLIVAPQLIQQTYIKKKTNLYSYTLHLNLYLILHEDILRYAKSSTYPSSRGSTLRRLLPTESAIIRSSRSRCNVSKTHGKGGAGTRPLQTRPGTRTVSVDGVRVLPAEGGRGPRGRVHWTSSVTRRK